MFVAIFTKSLNYRNVKFLTDEKKEKVKVLTNEKKGEGRGRRGAQEKGSSPCFVSLLVLLK